MSTTGNTSRARQPAPAELAICIRRFREARRWSQEPLAEISRPNVRTTCGTAPDSRPASANVLQVIGFPLGEEPG